MHYFPKLPTAIALTAAAVISAVPRVVLAEQRNAIAHPRTPFQLAFYNRHRPSYRVAGALHFGHSKLHDVLLLTPFEQHTEADAELYAEILDFMENPPRIEPTMELYAPYTARATWRLFRTIDSVHLLHEMTEDVMSDADIPWDQKEAKLREVYNYYRKTYDDVALSPAPLDITMRRAAVMMKPYFSLTRNYYPKNNNFFYAAHWWHPALYESFMVAGNDREQEQVIGKMEALFSAEVIPDPPKRMLLSRELAPRYSRLSPETANVFDNLHMLHGITYDIFAYDGWTIEQKRAELYRVLDAMAPQSGDEALIRKFPLPKPEINPVDYNNDWVKSADGAMTEMMTEMLDEMMAMMMPQHGAMTSVMMQAEAGHQDGHDRRGGDHADGQHGDATQQGHQGSGQGHEAPRHNHQGSGQDSSEPTGQSQSQRMPETPQMMEQLKTQLKTQLKLKLTPGIQAGELPGSFLDAMNAMMPEMQMTHGGMGPGESNPMMVEAMVNGWYAKYGDLADVEPMPMEQEPSAIAYLQ